MAAEESEERSPSRVGSRPASRCMLGMEDGDAPLEKDDDKEEGEVKVASGEEGEVKVASGISGFLPTLVKDSDPAQESADDLPLRSETPSWIRLPGRPETPDPPKCLKSANLKFSIVDVEDEVYCVRFSPDDKFIAVAYGDGTIGLNNTVTGRHSHFLSPKKGSGLVMPVTSMRWRPAPSRSKADLMATVSSDGGVSLWHVSARRRLFEVFEPDNQLFCVDYAADSSTFATAGKEPVVRVYDETTMKVIQTQTGGDQKNAGGHSNRIFSMKYHPLDPHIILTGSWDQKVQFWDTRTGYAVRALYGPLVSGDALDISGDGEMILTGSCRRDKQLQIWDAKTLKLLETIPWLNEKDEKASPCKLYTAQFSKNATRENFKTGSMMLAAGGSGPDEFKLYDMTSKQVFFYNDELNAGCFSLDFSADSDMLAVASGDGKVQVLTIDKKSEE